MLLLLPSGPLHAQTQVPDKDPVSVGVIHDNYPYAFVNERGELDGFAIELLQAVAKISHLDYTPEIGETVPIHQRFIAGELDMLVAYAYSEERAQRFDFSASYLDMNGSVFVRRALADRVRTWEDLRSLRVLVHPQSLGEKALIESGLAEAIVPAASVGDALAKIAVGEGDATLATRLSGASIINREKYDIIDLPITVKGMEVYYCFAVQKGNRDLLARLNEGLAILHRTGGYTPIYRRWFGHLEPRHFTGFEILVAVSIGLLIALLVAIASAVHQRTLRRRLDESHQARARSELHYQEVFDATPVALLVLHLPPEGGMRLQESNPAARKLFRWSGSPDLTDLQSSAPDLLPLWQAVLAVKPDTSPRASVLEIALPGSPALHLRWSAVREQTRVLLVVEDISAQVRAESELRTAERNLLQSQKLDALGTLTSGIAHDFNNILTGLLGTAELLRLNHSHDAEVHAAAENMLAGSRRARDLVRQILAFSRSAEPERRAVNLHQMTLETLNLLRAAIPKAIQLRYDGCPGSPTVLADPTQIHQVLMNLCTNAAQAIGDRGGTITVAIRRHTVRGGPHSRSPFGLDPAHYHCIDVEDTGGGMPPEVMARAFEPFFTTKTNQRGTGLGLSVAHGVIQKHGGTIAIESEPGRGTRVTVWLPAVESAAPADNLDLIDIEPVGDGQTHVLLVDDEASVTRVMQRMLTRLGFQVTACEDPLRAYELFAADPGRFRAVVSDLSMPTRSGLDLLRDIRRLRPDIPTLLMSGFWSNGSRDRARDLGVTILADKPVGLDEMHRFMKVLLA